MNQFLTEDELKSAQTQVAPFGDPIAYEFISGATKDGNTAYDFRVHVAAATFHEIITLTPDGKIDGLFFND